MKRKGTESKACIPKEMKAYESKAKKRKVNKDKTDQSKKLKEN